MPIYEVGKHEGQHYFSMGFVEGQSLADRLAHGPLPPREAADLTKRLAEAMTYAHERGVIHRDLKADNVLLDNSGKPRITDFGLAKKLEADSQLTGTGQIHGTPSYMPPEQAAGKTDEIGPSADVYALGAVLYTMLTGRPPFQAADPMETLLHVLDKEPVGPRDSLRAVNGTSTVPRGNAAGHFAASPRKRARVAEDAESESSARCGNDLPEMPAQRADTPLPECATAG